MAALRLVDSRHLPALIALVRDGRRLPRDSALTDAAATHRLAGYAVRADRGSPLRTHHIERVMACALRTRELPALAAVVREATGAEPIVIKGPAAAALHPDPSLRPFGDLDLVVPAGSLRDAAAALRGAGLQPSSGPRGAEPWAGFAEAHGHELALMRTVGRHTVAVEVHWRVTDDDRAGGLDHARLRTRARALQTTAGVLAPGPVEHLLVLAVHLAGDPSRTLGGVLDVGLAAGSLTDAEWTEAFSLAAELHLGWELHRVLDLADAHFGPGRARPAVRPPRPPMGPLRAAALRLPVPLAVHIGRLAALDGVAARTRYLSAGVRARRVRRPRSRA